MNVRAAIELIRPSHWVKNLVVFLPLAFGLQLTRPDAWGRVSLAAAAFCLMSSCVYALNDIRDRHRDREHPVKARRPVASGRIGIAQAGLLAAVLAALALAACGLLWLLWPRRGVSAALVAAAVVGYLLLQAAYMIRLKRSPVLDVVCIALGFVLRAVGGAVAIPVEISPWLFVMTFTVCLFMGFCKRFNEQAVLIEAGRAARHRPALAGYTPQLLTHLITLSAAIAVMGFILYSVDRLTILHFGTNLLVYTLPVFLYGVFRFAMLSMEGRFSDPMAIILHDRPFQATVLIWVGAAMVVLYYGRTLQETLGRLSP